MHCSKHGAGLAVDELLERVQIVNLHKADLDAHAVEGDLELQHVRNTEQVSSTHSKHAYLVVSAAVEGLGGNDVIAALRQGCDGNQLRGLAAGRGDGADAT